MKQAIILLAATIASFALISCKSEVRDREVEPYASETAGVTPGKGPEAAHVPTVPPQDIAPSPTNAIDYFTNEPA